MFDACEILQVRHTGLPDLSWHSVPKQGKVYQIPQNKGKYTKYPKQGKVYQKPKTRESIPNTQNKGKYTKNPKQGKIYQTPTTLPNGHKINIPNDRKIFQLANKIHIPNDPKIYQHFPF
jgi:hypothetical protein